MATAMCLTLMGWLEALHNASMMTAPLTLATENKGFTTPSIHPGLRPDDVWYLVRDLYLDVVVGPETHDAFAHPSISSSNGRFLHAVIIPEAAKKQLEELSEISFRFQNFNRAHRQVITVACTMAVSASRRKLPCGYLDGGNSAFGGKDDVSWFMSSCLLPPGPVRRGVAPARMPL